VAHGVRVLTFGAALGAAILAAGCAGPVDSAATPVEVSGAVSPGPGSAAAQAVGSPTAVATPTATGPAPPAADPVATLVPPTLPPGVARPAPLARITPITPELAARMASSWHEGCPVPLADLRYVQVPYVDPDGVTRTGELVVHADAAEDVAEVFRELWSLRYPIASMRLVDDYGGDDTASMNADNTSAFNCRPITGGTSWSEHAYGLALDLNPVENPYVVGGHVAPRAGRAYVDRPDTPGVLHADDAVVAAFARIGWVWGGTWTGRVLDYQHFSRRGR
jgi:hypothetical protein